MRTGTADARLQERVQDERRQTGQQRDQAQRRANLLRDLDDARMTRSVWIETHFDLAGADAKYAAAFAAYGLEVTPGRIEELARRIRAEHPAIREALIVALEDWWQFNSGNTRKLANPMRAIAAAADDDPWRRQLRAAATARDSTALRALSGQARLMSLPPPSLSLLARTLSFQGDRDEAEDLLRWARGRYLTDFWIHFQLGSLLLERNDDSPAILEEAIGCYRTALALRPAAMTVHNDLGLCLYRRKRLDEAILSYRRAIDLGPHASAHHNLGVALAAKHQLDEAVAEYEKAIDLAPKSALPHDALGIALRAKNQLDEAIAEHKKAIDLDPESASAHHNLGSVLEASKHLEEAIAEYKKAIDLDPKLASAHHHLGTALHRKYQLDEAIAEYKKALDLDPKNVIAHNDLGLLLRARGQLEEAVAEIKQAIELAPKWAGAHYSLGLALAAKNQLDDASAEYKKAIELQADFYAEANCNLANILQSQGQLSASLEFYKRGHASGGKRNDWHYPSAQWVANAERLVHLEAKLADVLGGKATATDNRERLGLLEVCRLKRQHAAAARLYADAFTSEAKLADDLTAGHRYNAACFASLAAAGQGTDAAELDEQEHRRLRQQALGWLRADLEQWTKRLEAGKPEDRQVMRATLDHWQRDTDLASVRDADALQKLTAQEQGAWRKLWADVAELLKKAGNARG